LKSFCSFKVNAQVVRFTVGCPDLFIFLEIVDKSTNSSTRWSGLFIDIFEFARFSSPSNLEP